MRAVELYPVVASLVEKFRRVGESLNHTFDFFRGGRVRFREMHAHDFAFELDVAGTDGTLLNTLLALSTWVADLADDETSVGFGGGGEFLEGLEAVTRERASTRDDGVAGGFELVEFDHDIAGENGTQLAFTPAFVEVDEVGGGDSSSGEILRIP